MAMVMKALLKPPPGHQGRQSKDKQDSAQKKKDRSPAGRGAGQPLEEMMTCRICESPYTPDADGKRLPRDLGCGHVFCQRCLTDCVSGSGSKSYIVCPLCKKKTTLNGNSVMDLPVNRQLLGVVRNHQRFRDQHGSGHHQRVREVGEGMGGLRIGGEEGKSRKKCGKGCSCDSKKYTGSGEKQLVLKSALKKPKSEGSAVTPQILYQEEEEPQISNNMYNEEGVHTLPGGMAGDADFIASLTDMLLMQPTSAEYVNSFGRFNEERTSPADFSGPTKISCSKENKVLVVDPDFSSVQAFSTEGHCLSNFSVPAVNGGCFLDEATLAISSPRGIELYRLSGRLLLTVPLSETVAIARHPDGGFVAAQPTRVSIGTNPTSKVKIHTISAVRQSPESPKKTFADITDVAVGSSGQIVVLDYRSVIVMDYEGKLQAIIDPTNLLLTSPSPQLVEEASDLFIPYALAVDPLSGQVIVSDADNRCISAFAVPGGGFVRCLVNLRDLVENDDIRGYGIAVNSVGQIFVVLRSLGLAEIAIFNI